MLELFDCLCFSAVFAIGFLAGWLERRKYKQPEKEWTVIFNTSVEKNGVGYQLWYSIDDIGRNILVTFGNGDAKLVAPIPEELQDHNQSAILAYIIKQYTPWINSLNE